MGIRGARILLIQALAAAVLVMSAALAGASAPTDIPVEECLACHAGDGVTLRFNDGGSVNSIINGSRYSGSVHGAFACTECHKGQRAVPHPKREYRSHAQYKAAAARACRLCHTDAKLRARPVHAALFEKEAGGTPVICGDCHRAHEVTRVAGGGMFAAEERFCLGCHSSSSLQLDFKDGGNVPANVNVVGLQNSVHMRLGCSDCHYGFSAESHPRRAFKSRRDYAVLAAEMCKRCHFDKYAKMTESIHFKLLSDGRINAPVCTDCHGAHSVNRARQDRMGSVAKCKKCHYGIYDIFAKSVHGSALIDESNLDVPTCIDCHTAHGTVDPRTIEFHDRIPALCGDCHSDRALMARYGLSTEVVTTYLSDFHGVTLGFYKEKETYGGGPVRYKPQRPIAVCTDCHGTHDITRPNAMGTAALRENLLKRCRACHEDAPANFPETWLSHYEPSMRNAPAVYLVNVMYDVTIPLMVAGLVLQVFLHIWRYLVNR